MPTMKFLMYKSIGYNNRAALDQWNQGGQKVYQSGKKSGNFVKILKIQGNWQDVKNICLHLANETDCV